MQVGPDQGGYQEAEVFEHFEPNRCYDAHQGPKHRNDEQPEGNGADGPEQNAEHKGVVGHEATPNIGACG